MVTATESYAAKKAMWLARYKGFYCVLDAMRNGKSRRTVEIAFDAFWYMGAEMCLGDDVCIPALQEEVRLVWFRAWEACEKSHPRLNVEKPWIHGVWDSLSEKGREVARQMLEFALELDRERE